LNSENHLTDVSSTTAPSTPDSSSFATVDNSYLNAPNSDTPDFVDLNNVRMNSDIGASVTMLNEVTDDTMVITGGTNFKYSIDLSQANLGDYQSAVIADVINALEMLGQIIF
jgi:hypothetical protein